MTTATAEPATSAAYDALIAHIRETNLLAGTAGLLGWDQETMMPAGGVAFRSKQLAQLAKLIHERKTDARVGDWLADCEADNDLLADPLSPQAVNVREVRRAYDLATKLPTDLVEAFARTTSLAKVEWAEARKASDFARFEPSLREVVGMSRRKAECLSTSDTAEPWDALADTYEPGSTAAEVEALFNGLRPRLVELVGKLMGSATPPSNAFNERELPIDAQERFVRFVAEQIGFDFERGRLDRSTHPFCGGTHCNDVRMTTRFHKNMLGDALGSTMHESGHGIYGQGLPADHIGEPMGDDVSLGIHESQSRMWENQVGRSRAFWQWCQPLLKDYFGDALNDLSIDDVYGGINIVRPSLIRVEADEATYNLHILVRFEVERALMRGDLSTGDLPAFWNERYKQYLGVDVPDDAHGCLQDIHWSMGAIGYFPTYTLGNLYAAQLFDKARADLADLDQQFARGEFSPLKSWLNENVHAHGMRYRAGELCEHVTGHPLSAEPLMDYLESKLLPIYGVD